MHLILCGIIASYFTYKWITASRSLRQLDAEPLNALFFGTLSIFTFFEILNISLKQDHALWVALFSGLIGLFVTSFYLLLIGRFFETKGSLSVIERSILIVLFISTFFELYIISQRMMLLQNGIVEFRDYWISVPIGVGLLFAPFIAFYNFISAIKDHDKSGIANAIKTSFKLILKITNPSNQKIRIARDFIHQLIFPIIIGTLPILRMSHLINWTSVYFVGLMMMFLWAFHLLLIYLNNTPEYFSFRIRVIGATMTIAFFTFNGIAWVVGNVYVKNYVNDAWIENSTSISYQHNAEAGYLIDREQYSFELDIGEQIFDLEHSIKLPFEFPFFDKSYSSIKVLMSGAVGFDEHFRYKDIQYKNSFHPAIYVYSEKLLPTIDARNAPFAEVNNNIAEQNASGVFINAQEEFITVTWQNLTTNEQRDAEYTIQLKMHSDGTILMSYSEMPTQKIEEVYAAAIKPILTGIVPDINGRINTRYSILSSLPFESASNEAILQHWDLDFRNYLAKIYLPIVIFMAISIIFFLLFVPRFFEKSLILPLEELLQGVKRIRNGDLNTPINAVYKDEIGYLASSFNEMTNAQSELIETLEEKVRTRSEKIVKKTNENSMLAERNRVSRELHDAVSQSLFSANLLADTLNNGKKRDAIETTNTLNKIKELNKDALSEMRLLLSQLRGTEVKSVSMQNALVSLIDNIKEHHSVSFELEIENDINLPGPIHHMFFRIAQESINNAAKHSKANKIKVYFDGTQNMAMLSIQDNGVGFDIKQSKDNSHGLQIMRERAKEFGADLEIISTPNQQTVIKLIWYIDGK